MHILKCGLSSLEKVRFKLNAGLSCNYHSHRGFMLIQCWRKLPRARVRVGDTGIRGYSSNLQPPLQKKLCHVVFDLVFYTFPRECSVHIQAIIEHHMLKTSDEYRITNLALRPLGYIFHHPDNLIIAPHYKPSTFSYLSGLCI
jgi:hypothetical protein